MTAVDLLKDGDFEITPAYGRDYKSAKAVKEDWNAGKDFEIRATGQKINKSDAEKFCNPGVFITIRYKSGYDVTVVRVNR